MTTFWRCLKENREDLMRGMTRMIVRAIVFSMAFTVMTGAALAQGGQAAPEPTKTFASAEDVMAILAKAKADLKPDQTMNGGRILHLAPYNANLEHRVRVGPAAVHEKEAELFYVIDGSGTMTTGGKLKDERRVNPENLTGTGIEGGVSQPMAKGDFMIVPENTPHWVSAINGTLVFMTFHVPRPVPGKP
jgi:mannose-6-phosphate isomerase-like protein (cupin superfamily)